jgi:prevent-host-death family protein
LLPIRLARFAISNSSLPNCNATGVPLRFGEKSGILLGRCGRLLGFESNPALAKVDSSCYGHMIMTMVKSKRLKTIPAGVFKAKCLAIMDEVQAKSQPVIITKHGKPVVKLVPVSEERDDIFGFLKGKATIVGDILSPIISEDEWEILK